MVYSFLLTLILGGIFTVLQGGMRYYRLANAQQEAQRQAAYALREIVKELANSHQGAVKHETAPRDYVLFLSADEALPAARGDWSYQGTSLEFKKWVTFYHDEPNRFLCRAESPLPSATVNPGGAPMPDFFADMLPLTPLVKMREVRRLEFQSLLSGTITCTVDCAIETGTNKTTEVQMVSSTRIRNL